MQPVVLHDERSSGKQQQINTEKDLQKIMTQKSGTVLISSYELSSFTFKKRYRDNLITTY